MDTLLTWYNMYASVLQMPGVCMRPTHTDRAGYSELAFNV